MGPPFSLLALRSIDLLPRNDFQFFPPKLAELQERELAAFKVKAGLYLITLAVLMPSEETERNPGYGARGGTR